MNFAAKDDIICYCRDKSIVIEEFEKYNIDEIWRNLNSNDNLDCDSIIDVWNLFDDINTSLNISFVGNDEAYTEVYDKLFYALNLPTINTSDKKFNPIWGENEIEKIKEVFKSEFLILDEIFKLST